MTIHPRPGGPVTPSSPKPPDSSWLVVERAIMARRNRRKEKCFWILVAFFGWSLRELRPAQAPLPPELVPIIERVERMITSELAKQEIGGVSVGIVSGADLVWTRSYGWADAERKVRPDKDSVYRIGSITKQFTALMLLQLVEDGKVHLGEPVEKYLPEINQLTDRPRWAPPITFVQLATMTAGLDRDPEDPLKYIKGPVSDFEKILLSAIPHTKYAFEPGVRSYYSNIGYAILGAALGRVAKQPFVDYVRERILAPLGMVDTDYEPNLRFAARVAKGHQVDHDGKIDTNTPASEQGGRGGKSPAGGLYSTVVDMARFQAFELGAGPETVLKKKALEDYFSRVHSAGAGLAGGYGIGFQLMRRGELVAVGHNGGVAGYHTSAFVDRKSRSGVIVLRNVVGKFDVTGLCLGILAEVAKARTSQTRAAEQVR